MQHELQNAYQLSQQLHSNPAIEIPAGCFGIVVETPAYCQFTDAMLPQAHRRLVRICGTRRIADYFVDKLVAELDEGEGYEVRYEVWPKAPVLPRHAFAATDDEIPF